MEISTQIQNLSEYRCQETLRDGRGMIIRSIRSSDKLALLEGFHKLSKESIHSRFFGGKHDLTVAELKYFTEVDFKTHVAIIAELESNNKALGVGRFSTNGIKEALTANIAITVDESSHGLGIGTTLFKHLILIARQLKVEVLSADILTSNTPILHIIEKLNLPVIRKENGAYVNIKVLIK